MKSRTIYLYRHGEDVGDIENLFGSWSDPDLTKKGKLTAQNSAKQLKNIGFEIILTSPLKRAKSSAKIIGKNLKIKVKTNVYLKERNTYGLLAGMSKDKARKKYPDLIRAYNAQEFIPGSERYDDFKNRMEILLKKLISNNQKQLLAVTHGFVITTIMEEFLGLNREKIGDGSYLGLEYKSGKFKVIDSYRISFSKGQKNYDSERYRKFK